MREPLDAKDYHLTHHQILSDDLFSTDHRINTQYGCTADSWQAVQAGGHL